MKEKVLEYALGFPGLVVLVISIFILIINSYNPDNDPKLLCEKEGGTYSRVVKSYSECKFPLND